MFTCGQVMVCNTILLELLEIDQTICLVDDDDGDDDEAIKSHKRFKLYFNRRRVHTSTLKLASS